MQPATCFFGNPRFAVKYAWNDADSAHGHAPNDARHDARDDAWNDDARDDAWHDDAWHDDARDDAHV